MNGNEKITDAFADIDTKYIQATVTAPQKKQIEWRKWGMAAACFVLIAALLSPMLFFSRNEPRTYSLSELETAVYSATDLAKIFEIYARKEAETTSYQTVSVPSPQELYLSELPTDEYIVIYEQDYELKAPDEVELQKFTDKIRKKMARALDVTFPEYTIEENTSFAGSVWLNADFDVEKYGIGSAQGNMQNMFSIHARATEENSSNSITLGDQVVMVDQTQSDEEILASLSEIKRNLFWIFDVNFTDSKVIRNYGYDGDYGVDYLYVYFYNSDDHPLNDTEDRVYSDYISITFDNYSVDRLSETDVYAADIYYRQHRALPMEVWRPIAKAKMLTLAQAETLLHQGYVFGGHSCPLCMKMQEEVSFLEYDYVDIEYIFGYDFGYISERNNEPQTGIPCYAFYKYLEDSETGNQIYAKTYVPAIELTGLEEYFESQISEHDNS